MERSFRIADHFVANDAPPLFLPDIGTFFNRDMKLAKRLVDLLKAAGVRIIKGEILHRIDLCLDDETVERYFTPETGVVEERWRNLMARKVLALDSYADLFGYCQNEGLAFVVSVYDVVGADFAVDAGASALKIASANLVHQPLIEHVACKNLPVIVDTGKASLEEIARAVQWFQDAGGRQLVIEHSPLAPPAPVDMHNLRMITTLRTIFDVPIGLSDHHSGDEMLYAATTLGAAVVEKGVCMDDASIDQDVHHAMRISAVGGAIRKCQNIHLALGSTMRYLRQDAPKHNQRMGLVARRDLADGEVLSFETADFAWPNIGIPVENWDTVNGWKIRGVHAQGSTLRWQDVEPPTA